MHGLLLREPDFSYVTITVHTASINVGQNNLCGDDYHSGQYTHNWLASYLRRAQCQWKFHLLLAANVDVNHQITCIFQMYSEGSTAVKQDNETAFQWFKKAADAVSE